MKFVCDACGARYHIDDRRVRGKILRISCKKCSHVITIREPAEVPQRRVESAVAAATAPAPDTGAIEWHYAVNGQTTGPLSEDALLDAFRSGRVGDEAYVWNESFTDWKPAFDVPVFQAAIDGAKTRARAAGAPRTERLEAIDVDRLRFHSGANPSVAPSGAADPRALMGVAEDAMAQTQLTGLELERRALDAASGRGIGAASSDVSATDETIDAPAPAFDERTVEAPAPAFDERTVEAPAPAFDERTVEASATAFDERTAEAPATALDEQTVEAPAPADPTADAPAPAFDERTAEAPAAAEAQTPDLSQPAADSTLDDTTAEVPAWTLAAALDGIAGEAFEDAAEASRATADVTASDDADAPGGGGSAADAPDTSAAADADTAAEERDEGAPAFFASALATADPGDDVSTTELPRDEIGDAFAASGSEPSADDIDIFADFANPAPEADGPGVSARPVEAAIETTASTAELTLDFPASAVDDAPATDDTTTVDELDLGDLDELDLDELAESDETLALDRPAAALPAPPPTPGDQEPTAKPAWADALSAATEVTSAAARPIATETPETTASDAPTEIGVDDPTVQLPRDLDIDRAMLGGDAGADDAPDAGSADGDDAPSFADILAASGGDPSASQSGDEPTIQLPGRDDAADPFASLALDDDATVGVPLRGPAADAQSSGEPEDTGSSVAVAARQSQSGGGGKAVAAVVLIGVLAAAAWLFFLSRPSTPTAGDGAPTSAGDTAGAETTATEADADHEAQRLEVAPTRAAAAAAERNLQAAMLRAKRHVGVAIDAAQAARPATAAAEDEPVARTRREPTRAERETAPEPAAEPAAAAVDPRIDRALGVALPSPTVARTEQVAAGPGPEHFADGLRSFVRASIVRCNQRQIAEAGALDQARVALELTVQPSGRVSSLSIDDGLDRTAFGRCLATHRERWLFPSFAGDAATLEKTYVLQ